jgi:hypothetical protein
MLASRLAATSCGFHIDLHEQRENLDFVFAGPRARLAMLCVRLQSAAWEGIEREMGADS